VRLRIDTGLLHDLLGGELVLGRLLRLLVHRVVDYLRVAVELMAVV
jgi:hypothetical protein